MGKAISKGSARSLKGHSVQSQGCEMEKPTTASCFLGIREGRVLGKTSRQPVNTFLFLPAFLWLHAGTREVPESIGSWCLGLKENSSLPLGQFPLPNLVWSRGLAGEPNFSTGPGGPRRQEST